MIDRPNETIASRIVAQITHEHVIDVSRFTTGEQFFVYGVTTDDHQYVLRLALPEHKSKFIAGLYWQEKLIPLGIPLAPFIHNDLEEKYSCFPALLMMRLPGDDLCNVYASLSSDDKKNLANEMVYIQAKTELLPDGPGYGIIASYESLPEAETWFDFIVNRLIFFKKRIHEIGVFDAALIDKVIAIAHRLKNNFCSIRARPFLWDASERNVLVHEGKITGIVDVDNLCFGDPLFVIGLTAIALENEGQDTLYTDFWVETLRLDEEANSRLAFYKLFYVIVFMYKHASSTSNQKIVQFGVGRLNRLFEERVGYF